MNVESLSDSVVSLVYKLEITSIILLCMLVIALVVSIVSLVLHFRLRSRFNDHISQSSVSPRSIPIYYDKSLLFKRLSVPFVVVDSSALDRLKKHSVSFSRSSHFQDGFERIDVLFSSIKIGYIDDPRIVSHLSRNLNSNWPVYAFIDDSALLDIGIYIPLADLASKDVCVTGTVNYNRQFVNLKTCSSGQPLLVDVMFEIRRCFLYTLQHDKIGEISFNDIDGFLSPFSYKSAIGIFKCHNASNENKAIVTVYTIKEEQ